MAGIWRAAGWSGTPVFPGQPRACLGGVKPLKKQMTHVVFLKPVQFGFSPKQDCNRTSCALPAQRPGLEPQVGMAPKPATSSVNVSDSLLPPHFCPPSHALHLNHLCSLESLRLQWDEESIPVSLALGSSPFLSEPSLPFQHIPHPSALPGAVCPFTQGTVSSELRMGFLDPLSITFL